MATQSLYRRYRPGRFDQLKGQQHVVRALRDSIANGREGQAYLFSGPRGTGKTTTARIMAKALNCEHVEGGEPCGECESCRSIDSGTSYDVHELDAASNNGVDAIRDLIEKASLGTPGRHKVYILDEVHMLSNNAEAALLKTLEEPPPHVVFVLATTDPQKMSDTIRSRTQHLQFHLLPASELEEHIQWVAQDAGYELSADAFEAALERGGGSARDTLSALELIASTGGSVGDVTDVDGLLTALIEGDAAAALTIVAAGVSQGLDPRQMTEDLVRHLRNGFLSLVAPDVVVMSPDRLGALSERARAYGAPRLVRAIEGLGSTLTDLRNAPDPRVLVEVALVQLIAQDQDPAVASAGAPSADISNQPHPVGRPAGGPEVVDLAARLERLEQQLAQGIAASVVAPVSENAPAPIDPATGRKVLGGAAARARAKADQASSVHNDPSPSPAADVSSDAAGGANSFAPNGDADGSAGASDASNGGLDAAHQSTTPQPSPATTPMASVLDVWEEVRSSLKPLARAVYSAGEMTEPVPGQAVLRVGTDAQAAKCREHQGEVAAALTGAIGAPVSLEIATGTGQAARTGADGAGMQPAAQSTVANRADTGSPTAEAQSATGPPATGPTANAMGGSGASGALSADSPSSVNPAHTNADPSPAASNPAADSMAATEAPQHPAAPNRDVGEAASPASSTEVSSAEAPSTEAPNVEAPDSSPPSTTVAGIETPGAVASQATTSTQASAALSDQSTHPATSPPPPDEQQASPASSADHINASRQDHSETPSEYPPIDAFSDPGAFDAHEFEDESMIDLDDLEDAPPESYKGPAEKLAEAFPGLEQIEDDR